LVVSSRAALAALRALDIAEAGKRPSHPGPFDVHGGSGEDSAAVGTLQHLGPAREHHDHGGEDDEAEGEEVDPRGLLRHGAGAGKEGNNYGFLSLRSAKRQVY